MNLERVVAGAEWIKSSYSDGSGGACVEFSRTLIRDHRLVPVRDSKAPQGPVLVFPAGIWTSFVTEIRRAGLGPER
ncbi:DUF397 domain-containing protein [Streptomyces sp. TS71-3]|uniref:DUF397 domain-containing protein n=1 Tax=Streptomyces sp. TS71-3 TaxID=2733862 RepID=UPI001B0A6693|nr:DUF397 domain-containing protein [Streptomyces sp. TS71-3]GHJ39832.1 hypothetical protein Sm713_54410 [Streptomyces sp. TS71-3]